MRFEGRGGCSFFIWEGEGEGGDGSDKCCRKHDNNRTTIMEVCNLNIFKRLEYFFIIHKLTKLAGNGSSCFACHNLYTIDHFRSY